MTVCFTCAGKSVCYTCAGDAISSEARWAGAAVGAGGVHTLSTGTAVVCPISALVQVYSEQDRGVIITSICLKVRSFLGQIVRMKFKLIWLKVCSFYGQNKNKDWNCIYLIVYRMIIFLFFCRRGLGCYIRRRHGKGIRLLYSTKAWSFLGQITGSKINQRLQSFLGFGRTVLNCIILQTFLYLHKPRRYLCHNCSKTFDLWFAFEDVSGRPLRDITYAPSCE